MIIENGHIEFKFKTGGGINPETGHAIKPSFTWGEPIPCQWCVNTYSNRGKANGEHFTAASYEILVEGCWLTNEQIRLTDANGAIIGEFSVDKPEYLAAVDQTKLLV